MTVEPVSMFYWYPKIKDAVPTPRTVMIEADGWKLLEELEAEVWPEARRVEELIMEAIETLGGYPVFLRTDLTANKHDWIRTCYISVKSDIKSHIFALTDFSFAVDIGLSGFAVREFLQLESKFEAFQGMPVAREYRVFAEKGNVLCIHPYWPKEAMRFYKSTPLDWQSDLEFLSAIVERERIEKLALRAEAAINDGFPWSIDVCRDIAGKWWVTDMAPACRSYHWKGCSVGENAKGRLGVSR